MIHDERGLTLIEVLVVSAIIVLVVAGAYSFSIFGQRLFRTGNAEAELHAELRMAAEKINRELRFAEGVELLVWDPESADTDKYSFIYFDTGSSMVMLEDNRGSRPLSSGAVSGITFAADKEMLLYTIEGASGSTTFKLDSSVQPMNQKGNIKGPEGSQALRFTGTP